MASILSNPVLRCSLRILVRRLAEQPLPALPADPATSSASLDLGASILAAKLGGSSKQGPRVGVTPSSQNLIAELLTQQFAATSMGDSLFGEIVMLLMRSDVAAGVPTWRALVEEKALHLLPKLLTCIGPQHLYFPCNVCNVGGELDSLQNDGSIDASSSSNLQQSQLELRVEICKHLTSHVLRMSEQRDSAAATIAGVVLINTIAECAPRDAGPDTAEIGSNASSTGPANEDGAVAGAGSADGSVQNREQRMNADAWRLSNVLQNFDADAPCAMALFQRGITALRQATGCQTQDVIQQVTAALDVHSPVLTDSALLLSRNLLTVLRSATG